MLLEPELLPFLKGERFSHAVRASFLNTPLVDRISWLEKKVAGKRVIHVGCVDHLPLIEQKRAQGQWLHARLCAAAQRCTGIDINAEGIRHLKSLGYQDVHACSLLGNDVPDLSEERWDTMVLGEMIEHTDDPVAFLTNLAEAYRGAVESVILTTPNAFSLQNMGNAVRGVEVINSDHRYWFTPYTLAKVLQRAGLEPKELDFVSSSSLHVGGLRSALRRQLQVRCPALRDTLVVEARIA
ncbi:MAG: methyltransferase domain-containing protein [Myxococcales bacterium]|nr:methyltransferase domain-containing protein [Myxococcales bacterium]